MVIQAIVDALGNGGLYGLAALGIGLVFGVMRLVNFAHGELVALGAYLLMVTLRWGVIPAILVALAGVAALAIVMDLGVFSRLRGAEPSVLLIASFGVSVLLQRCYELVFGALPLSGQVAPWMAGVWTLGDVRVSRGSVTTLTLTLALLAVMKVAVERTTVGLQLRAASADFRTARLLGVRSNRVILSAFAVSGLLAAVVAFFVVAQRGQVDPRFGVNITILALVGTVVGGLGSLQGAALGGMLVGITLSVLNTVLGAARVYSYTVLFVLVITVLLLRPTGLLSRGVVKERV
ncbi:branched-chain amino acid ABC transporter permease [Xylanimonas allomyrinae]|uniref:Branched-chain amino acid ABC transporter permease n=1 Tax=Xylanimonas allomyrinae TaxID=2509459 RepID=A0A4P6ER93_9MICO|nr:branched-chain amino acid ABC transporter permease [Xylanimonas allomyrinae]QAY62877.1 branched-chain amino acid ABC transporter permease [Xylanimonas allomyrinae]